MKHYYIRQYHYIQGGQRVPMYELYESSKVTELHYHDEAIKTFDTRIEAETYLQMLCGFRTASLYD